MSHNSSPALAPRQNTSNALALITVNLDDLKRPDRAVRKHPKRQIEKLSQSLSTFGWVSPVLIDRTNQIIAGVARIEAAHHLGLTTAPAVRIEHLTDAEIRAYRIADNKLAEAAEWDETLLSIELREIELLGFDLEFTGFETAEIDILFDAAEAEDTEEPPVPPLQTQAVSRLGDHWIIGEHQLICGDALEDRTYAALLSGQKADMVFTDPPYNVPVQGHMGGLGAVRHREFVMASGEMTARQFRSFLATTMKCLQDHTRPGGIVFACMDWRSISPLIEETQSAGLHLLNLCVWNKTNGGMGSLYRSKHELIVVARVHGAKHCNNVELGRHGRNRTNVWDYPGANTPGTQMQDLALHPTVKPVALVADAILDVSKRGDIVLDPFGGSGSTLLAAERTNRKARLIELDPLYVDTIIRRAEAVLGLKAILASNGLSFDEVATRRRTTDPSGIRCRQRPAPSFTQES